MIKVFLIIVVLLLAIIIGAVYFVLWPLAQQYLVAITAVLQPVLESVSETLPAVPPEGVEGIAGLLGLLPILESIGADVLGQFKELAAGGVTIEEAQQALDILRQKLPAEDLAFLLALLNLLP